MLLLGFMLCFCAVPQCHSSEVKLALVQWRNFELKRGSRIHFGNFLCLRAFQKQYSRVLAQRMKYTISAVSRIACCNQFLEGSRS